MTDEKIVKTRIGYSFPQDSLTLQAAVFDVIAEISFPIIEQFRSDLFHDALWIRNTVNGPMSFYFSLNESGTYIYSENVGIRRKYMYRIDCNMDDRLEKWTVTATKMEDAL